MSDVFEQLLPCKWREVEFPITRLRMSLAHDLVEHKYYGVDGARVEDTGLAPMRFSLNAPLTNGIVPGKNERWSVLYPTAFRALLAAFQRRDVGFLQHPEFGLIRCKAERLEVDWDANKRGGVDAELSFVETLPDDESVDIFEESPVQVIELAALDLDASTTKADLEALLAAKGIKLPKFKKDFTDMARSITAVVDTVTVMQHKTAGRINSIVYRAESLKGAVDRARDATTWPITKAAEKIVSAAHDLRQKLAAANRDIIVFVVPADTTIAGVARQLAETSVGDLIKLNPHLMAMPVIPRGSIVRYYAPSLSLIAA